MFSIKEDGQFPLSFVIKQVEVNEKVVFQKKKKEHDSEYLSFKTKIHIL